MALPLVEGPTRVHIKFLACQHSARTEDVKGKQPLGYFQVCSNVPF
jgi:hypothetical protein